MPKKIKSKASRAHKRINVMMPELNHISAKQLNEIIDRITGTILHLVPEADYEADSWNGHLNGLMEHFQNFGLEGKHNEDLVTFRHFSEEALSKVYKMKYTYNLLEDIGPQLRKRKVPQQMRVKSGVIDSLIAKTGLMTGQLQHVAPGVMMFQFNR